MCTSKLCDAFAELLAFVVKVSLRLNQIFACEQSLAECQWVSHILQITLLETLIDTIDWV